MDSNDTDVMPFSDTQEEEVDGENLEKQEIAAYFWKAILLLLIIITIVSVIIKRI